MERNILLIKRWISEEYAQGWLLKISVLSLLSALSCCWKKSFWCCCLLFLTVCYFSSKYFMLKTGPKTSKESLIGRFWSRICKLLMKTIWNLQNFPFYVCQGQQARSFKYTHQNPWEAVSLICIGSAKPIGCYCEHTHEWGHREFMEEEEEKNTHHRDGCS